MRATLFLLTIMSTASSSAEGLNRWKKPDGEPLFIAVSQKDQKMAEACKKARATFPAFLKARSKPEFNDAITAVKVRIKDEAFSRELKEDQFAFIWIYNVSEEGGSIKATIMELPKGGLNDLKVDQSLLYPKESIYDWMIIKDEKAWGAFTLQVVRNSLPEKERAQYDEYSGIFSYSSELP